MQASYITIGTALLGLVTAAACAAVAEAEPATPDTSAECEPSTNASAARSAAPKTRGDVARPGPPTRSGGAGVHAVGSRLLLSEIQLILDDRALAKHRISGDAAADAILDLLDRLVKKDGGGGRFLLEDFEGAQVTVDGKTLSVRDLGKVRVTFFLEEPVPDGAEVKDLNLWTCQKHPKVITEKPGLCPICQSELVRLTSKQVERFKRLDDEPETNRRQANTPSPKQERQQ